MINKKRVDALIPRAIEVAGELIAVEGKIENKYNGYISSFGASIIQAGLLSSIAFFSKSGVDKSKIIDAIKKLLEKDDLIAFAKNDQKNAKQQITEAAVALKLAMRVFEKSDEKQNNEED